MTTPAATTQGGAIQPPDNWPNLIGATIANGINRWIDVEVIRATPPAAPPRDPLPPTPQGATLTGLGGMLPLLLVGAVLVMMLRR